jgi:hypothetical protein
MASTAGNRRQEADANLTRQELAGSIPTLIVRAELPSAMLAASTTTHVTIPA